MCPGRGKYTGTEDLTFYFSWFLFAFIVFCFCLQCCCSLLPLFLNASVALPYQKNMRTISVSTHIYQVATPHWALCRGRCCGGTGMRETQPTCTGIRCCLAPPAWPFLVFYLKTSLFLYPSSCSFSPSVYLLLLGNVFERVFLDLLDSISFDLASVLQLFIFLLVYL